MLQRFTVLRCLSVTIFQLKSIIPQYIRSGILKKSSLTKDVFYFFHHNRNFPARWLWGFSIFQLQLLFYVTALALLTENRLSLTDFDWTTNPSQSVKQVQNRNHYLSAMWHLRASRSIKPSETSETDLSCGCDLTRIQSTWSANKIKMVDLIEHQTIIS